MSQTHIQQCRLQPQQDLHISSYQRQLRCKSLLKDEIEGYKIGCKHISWIQKFDEFLGRKSTLELDLKNRAPKKVVVWGYFPPTNPKGQGIFRVFYSNEGIHAPKKECYECSSLNLVTRRS